METGFVKLRRGLLDHLKRGSMSVREAASYMAIILQADHETGTWWGSASALRQLYRDLDENSAYSCLRSLENKGYIKRFRVNGTRGRYPIMVNKYRIKQFATSFQPIEREINTDKTTDWRHPFLESETSLQPVFNPYKENKKKEINNTAFRRQKSHAESDAPMPEAELNPELLEILRRKK